MECPTPVKIQSKGNSIPPPLTKEALQSVQEQSMEHQDKNHQAFNICRSQLEISGDLHLRPKQKLGKIMKKLMDFRKHFPVMWKAIFISLILILAPLIPGMGLGLIGL